MDAINQQAALLNLVGVLPSLGTLRAEINARQIAAKIMAVLDEHDVDDEVVHAMYLAVGGDDELWPSPLALNRAEAD